MKHQEEIQLLQKDIQDIRGSTCYELADCFKLLAFDHTYGLKKGTNIFAVQTGKGNAQVRIKNEGSLLLFNNIGHWWMATNSDGSGVIGSKADDQRFVTYSVGEDPDRPNIPGQPIPELPELPENGICYWCVDGKKDDVEFEARILVEVWRDDPDPIELPSGYANLDGSVYKLEKI